jgi:hypothetical protein
MPTFARRLERLEHEAMRRQFQAMTDQDWLDRMSEEYRQQWYAEGVSDAEIVRGVREVLKDWGYL